MGDLTDPDDDMGPAELIDAASDSLLTVLASLEDIRRSLRGRAEPPRHERLNVVLLAARRPRKRGAFPRGVE